MAGRQGPRMTGPTRAVLGLLLEDPDATRYGLEIGRAAGLPSGTVHPILARLEGVGWVESDWEDVDTAAAGRPRRRYYRLTAGGVRAARAALVEAEARRHRIVGGTVAPRPLGSLP